MQNFEKDFIKKHFSHLSQKTLDTLATMHKEKLRPAIMSLLGKDRDLYMELKHIVDLKEIPTENLEETLVAIRQYLGQNTPEALRLGDVPTPLRLVGEMLDDLPEEVWSDPYLKWLDPACGKGGYLLTIAQRLMNGLKEWEPDDHKRYAHIFGNMLYGCDILDKNIMALLYLADPESKYETHFTCCDYLSATFTDMLKKTWNIKRFDIVIGNPPYQKNADAEKTMTVPVYDKFVRKSTKLSDKTMFITPSRWFTGAYGLEDMRKYMSAQGHVRFIKHYDRSSDVFGKEANIKGGVSYFLYDIDHTGPTLLNGTSVHLSAYDVVPTSLKKEDIEHIARVEKHIELSKCKLLSDICYGASYFGIETNDKRLSRVPTETHTVPCFVSLAKGGKHYLPLSAVPAKCEYFHKWKVLTSKAYGSGPAFNPNFHIGKPGEVCSRTYIFFGCDTEQEALSLKSYLQTNFANKLLSLRKSSQFIKPDTCKWIPLVPLDRIWTDDKVAQYLTDFQNGTV